MANMQCVLQAYAYQAHGNVIILTTVGIIAMKCTVHVGSVYVCWWLLNIFLKTYTYYVSSVCTFTICLNRDETATLALLVNVFLFGLLELPDDFLPGDFSSISFSSVTCVRRYCSSSLFMVLSHLLFNYLIYPSVTYLLLFQWPKVPFPSNDIIFLTDVICDSRLMNQARILSWYCTLNFKSSSNSNSTLKNPLSHFL